MGWFDNRLHGVEYRKGDNFDNRGVYKGSPNEPKFSGANVRAGSNMLFFTPQSYDDVQVIIDHLKISESIILNLKDIKPETGQRIIDFLSGAIYALSGSIMPLENGLYVLAPDGVNVSSRDR